MNSFAMLQVNMIDSPQEWGIVGVIVTMVLSLLGIFVWWVRAARLDLQVNQREFLAYIREQSAAALVAQSQNAEATLAIANSLHRLTERMDRHDEREAERHRQDMEMYRRIHDERREVSP